MKKIILVIMATSLIVFNIVALGFSAKITAETQFSDITKDIPNIWWDGGWDKLKELQDFISNNPDDMALCAKAQYYIGCYYYSKKQYQKAIDEYGKVIKTYPSANAECCNAQLEIGQITLNCLNKPKEAIVEYQKIVSNYPNDCLAPVAQLMTGRAYIKLQNKTQAKVELQKVINNYPSAKGQWSEACVELGNIAASEGANKEALSYYKKAYIACPPADSNAMVGIIDKIYESLRNLDNSVARANQFIEYQKYGPAGEDKKTGTADDLTNVLAEF